MGDHKQNGSLFNDNSILSATTNYFPKKIIAEEKEHNFSNIYSYRASGAVPLSRSIVKYPETTHNKLIVKTSSECIIPYSESRKVRQMREELAKQERETGDLSHRFLNLDIKQVQYSYKQDGKYFLKLLQQENKRLLELAETADQYMEIVKSLPGNHEEVLGILRSAASQARLLTSGKLNNFFNVCQNNIRNSQATNHLSSSVENLQSYWEMIHIEIARIDTKFRDIELIKKNNWKMNKSIGPPGIAMKPRAHKVIKPKVLSRPEAIAAAAAAERERKRGKLDRQSTESIPMQRSTHRLL